jgi:hypothetical protein
MYTTQLNIDNINILKNMTFFSDKNEYFIESNKKSTRYRRKTHNFY